MNVREAPHVAVSPQELAGDAQLAHFAVQTVEAGTGRGTRVATVAPAGGLHARVLVDRGLDIGAVWFGGMPLAWSSGMGEHPAGYADARDGWHDGWAGGLLTTCGLRNVGVSSEGHGHHGRYSDQAADEFAVKRERSDDGSPRLVVEGVIREPVGLGRGLVLRRRIVFPLWQGRVEIDDVVTNEAFERLQAPMLYHVNIGAPFLDAESVPRARVGSGHVPMAGVSAMGAPAFVPDVVQECAVEPPADWAECAIDSSRLGLRLAVGWDRRTMPRLFVWQRRTPGTYVTAIEPANASVRGRAADRADGTAPWLEPGETRRTRLRVCVTALASAGDRRVA